MDKKQGTGMKIATFNCNSLRSRMEIVLDWLAKNKPDILCLQETKVQDDEFPLSGFADTDYNVVFSGEKKYNGVAILSRVPADDVKSGLDSDPKDPARLIRGRFNNIVIVNTYIPQGYDRDSEKFLYKLIWFQRLRKYFSKHLKPAQPVIWLGDLNVAHKDMDVYDPVALDGSVCFCREVIEEFEKTIQWGFVDLFRKHCGKAGQYTFWDYRIPNGFKRNLGWRLDYIMATRPLAQRCTSCRIDTQPRMADKPSDHTFVVAEFND